MRRKDLKARKIPDTSGVYIFTHGKKILYIGKATSLRDRVRSYFTGDVDESRGPLIVKMLEEASGIDVKETDSVLEALVLEAYLIRKHKPRYNSIGKDNKSYSYVVITDEDYPRVFTLRQRDLLLKTKDYKLKTSYGPFPSGSQLKEALRIIRKIFPFRGERDSVEKGRQGRSYLNREIGLSPDFSKVSKRDYARTIRNIKLFFESKKIQLLKKLEQDMLALAKDHKFEKAEEVKRQIFALKHIRDVSLIRSDLQVAESGFRIEAYDVAHISGTSTVGVMVVVEGGMPSKTDYRKFKIENEKLKANDTGALREILERRFGHYEWRLPKLIVVDGSKAQINVAQKVLNDFGYQISVVAVTKGERHEVQRLQGELGLISKHEKDILVANAEAHRFALAFHRQLRRKY